MVVTQREYLSQESAGSCLSLGSNHCSFTCSDIQLGLPVHVQSVSSIRLAAIVVIIPDIVINFSNSFSFAITKYTQLSRIVIIVYSNIWPIMTKFIFQKTFITLFLHRL